MLTKLPKIITLSGKTSFASFCFHAVKAFDGNFVFGVVNLHMVDKTSHPIHT